MPQLLGIAARTQQPKSQLRSRVNSIKGPLISDCRSCEEKCQSDAVSDFVALRIVGQLRSSELSSIEYLTLVLDLTKFSP